MTPSSSRALSASMKPRTSRHHPASLLPGLSFDEPSPSSASSAFSASGLSPLFSFSSFSGFLGFSPSSLVLSRPSPSTTIHHHLLAFSVAHLRPHFHQPNTTPPPPPRFFSSISSSNIIITAVGSLILLLFLLWLPRLLSLLSCSLSAFTINNHSPPSLGFLCSSPPPSSPNQPSSSSSSSVNFHFSSIQAPPRIPSRSVLELSSSASLHRRATTTVAFSSSSGFGSGFSLLSLYLSLSAFSQRRSLSFKMWVRV